MENKLNKLIGKKIIAVGNDYIQLDDGKKIYLTKKEMEFI